ncbi:hypothetical protein niasHT_009437 [Heterodera trifolii]|uniref:RRM domain-containing protein n=1 Tax=Heterodera trifolii TaxID=157864 RepID=A0ABD2MF42_9BILA
MKWGMICSVESPELVPDFEKFGQWMVAELQKAAIERRFWHYFMPSPNFLLYASPGSVEEVTKCYEMINLSFPDVSYVIHVLPSKDSVEHQLLKELTHNGALIGQGVLAYNALNHFDCYDLDEVMFRMNQWIARRLTQIMARPNDNLKPSRRKKDIFRIVVANSAEEPPPASPFNKEIHSQMPLNSNKERFSTQQDIDYSVGVVLHKKCFAAEPISDRLLKSIDQQTNELTQNGGEGNKGEVQVFVKGFPTTFNKFQIASLFPDFRPLHVEYHSGGEAVVHFANKYHAAQVVRNYNGLSFENENFILEVRSAGNYQRQFLQDKLNNLCVGTK